MENMIATTFVNAVTEEIYRGQSLRIFFRRKTCYILHKVWAWIEKECH